MRNTTTTPYYASRRQQNWNRNQNTVAFASAVKLGPVTHTILVALMITILGLIYLTQATRATAFDYKAQEIDQQISSLSAKKTDLEVENARLTALDSVKTSDVARQMTQPASVELVE